jgi:hypothetical protein
MKTITIYKITHAPDCPRLVLPDDAMEVLRASDTKDRCKRWPANPVKGKLGVRGKVSSDQFYFVDNSVLVLPESMLVKYEDIHWVTAYNATAVRIVAGGVNFELIDILEIHCSPHHDKRGAPCFIDSHLSPLCRIEADPLGIYATSGHLEPRDEFVGACQHWGLKGLIYEPVWMGEV